MKPTKLFLYVCMCNEQTVFHAIVSHLRKDVFVCAGDLQIVEMALS